MNDINETFKMIQGQGYKFKTQDKLSKHVNKSPYIVKGMFDFDEKGERLWMICNICD